MARHIRCGKLFTGAASTAETDQTLVVADGLIGYVGPTSRAPKAAEGDTLIDRSDSFVMPGLLDFHCHLSYGEAKTEEDIDLYASTEFRAIRGVEAAQRILKAGFTTIVDPTTTGRVSLAIRDAFAANLFQGPRMNAGGRQITTRQGLSDWYPIWVGVPETSIGVLVTNPYEAIEEVRRQVKDGVDFVKIAMDGDSMNPSTGLIAAFNQEETTAMVREIHRLGRRVIVHARGAEGVLYAARAGVDIIFHASWMDDEGLDAVVKNGCAICPSLSLPVNSIEFTRPTDGCYPGLPDAHKRELEAAAKNLAKARKAGVKFLMGSENGFAVTPYGEWNAKEIENHVKYIGFSPADALRSATSVNASYFRGGSKVGTLEVGRNADILSLAGNPLDDIALLQDKTKIRSVMLGGEEIDLTPNDRRRRLASEFSYNMWGEVYTQRRVGELLGQRARVH